MSVQIDAGLPEHSEQLFLPLSNDSEKLVIRGIGGKVQKPEILQWGSELSCGQTLAKKWIVYVWFLYPLSQQLYVLSR